MGRDVAFGLALALFLLRDGRALASRPRAALGAAPLWLAAAAACGLLAERLSAPAAESWIRDARIWLPAALIHVAFALRAAKLAGRGQPPAWSVLAPSPVWCVAVVGGLRRALVGWHGWTGWSVGLAFGCAYCAVAALVALALRDRRDPRPALRLAAASHCSALLLIPVAAVAKETVRFHGVDWRVTAAVLAGVGAMLASSFAWHRRRR